MLEFLSKPWPWYVAGPLIGLMVPALLLLGNKSLGISSSLRHVCAMCMPGNIKFFQYDWKKEAWNLFYVVGIGVGAFLATEYLANPDPMTLGSKTLARLSDFGLAEPSGLQPLEIFGLDQILSLKGLVFLVIGGFMVGFGTRYAGGCTSGHTIMGLSNLQWPSLVATMCFMIGGLVMTHLILPQLFNLF
ncbi:YeeE/YedE family protein [Jiulongibacter sp. NS-SX5]|uniref:YeeE/YedE family protein n=1 Tax=Jiulongibacter sp. NS-SX5 TaxID=3463854 RepID=UPI00405A317D